MKRITLLLMALGLGAPVGFAQGNNMAPSTTDPQKVMELLAWDISERCQFSLGSGKQFIFRTILMTEPVAAILSGKYRSAEALERALIGASRRPLKERASANYYANPGKQQCRQCKS